MMRAIRRFIDVAGPLVVGLVAGNAAWMIGIDMRVMGSARANLLSAVLGFAAFLVSVLLAMLGVLIGLDGRPIIARMKDKGVYDRLVLLAFVGVCVFVSLATACIVGLLAVDSDPQGVLRAIGSIVLGLIVAGLIETVRFSWYLTRTLRIREEEPGERDTPAQARHNLKPPILEEPDGDGESRMATIA